MQEIEKRFHLHLISDSTGDTLSAASKAVTSQYQQAVAIEHIHSSIKNKNQLNEVVNEIKKKPGIVLFTIIDQELVQHLTDQCNKIGVPCVSILTPIFETFKSYLGLPSVKKVGAQHELNSDYFNRIDALNFTLFHDDGMLPENLEEADVILLGISRTSKTPTSIYLANKGIKTINIPMIPTLPIDPKILEVKKPLVIALVASIDRIYQVRQNRLLAPEFVRVDSQYTDRAVIADELTQSRKLCKQYNWPMIDVTRRSIEETASLILTQLKEHQDQHIQKQGNS